MSRQYLDDITLDIANAYATLTNRDSNWVNHLSISDFVEIRKQAILELEKNFSSKNEIPISKQEEKPKQPIEPKKEIPIVSIKPKETPKTIKKDTNIPKETSNIYNSSNINIQTPKNTEEKEEKTETNVEEKVFDKRHDQEELDLFNRLKD